MSQVPLRGFNSPDPDKHRTNSNFSTQNQNEEQHRRSAHNHHESTYKGNERSNRDRYLSSEGWQHIEDRSTQRNNRSELAYSMYSNHQNQTLEFMHSPPMSFTLKLKMKIRSNHSSSLFPLSDVPNLTSSRVTEREITSPLNGVYRRVQLLAGLTTTLRSIKNLKESQFPTRLDYCAIESSKIIISCSMPSLSTDSTSSIRYFVVDLDTVYYLPQISRNHSQLHFNSSSTSHSSQNSSNNNNNNNSKYFSQNNSSSQTLNKNFSNNKNSSIHQNNQNSTSNRDQNYFKSIIGDDFGRGNSPANRRNEIGANQMKNVGNQNESSNYQTEQNLLKYSSIRSNSPTLTWTSAGHQSPIPFSSFDSQKSSKSRPITDSELLSASVTSPQTVLITKNVNEGKKRYSKDDFSMEDEIAALSISETDNSQNNDKNLHDNDKTQKTDTDERNEEKNSNENQKNQTTKNSSDSPQKANNNIDNTEDIHDIEYNDVPESIEEAKVQKEAENQTTKTSKESEQNINNNIENIDKIDKIEHDVVTDSVEEVKIEKESENQITDDFENSAVTNELGQSSFASTDTKSSNITSNSFSDSPESMTPGTSTPTSTSSFSSRHTTNDASDGLEYLAIDIETSNFKVELTSHCINRVTTTWSSFDCLAGFKTGDILKYDPRINKDIATREKGQTKWKQFNENGIMMKGSVRKIAWISHDEFIVSFSDGFLYVFNTAFDDDPNFSSTDKDPRMTKLPNKKNQSSKASSSNTNIAANTTQNNSLKNSQMNQSSSNDLDPKKSGTNLSNSSSSQTPVPPDGWITEWVWRRIHANYAIRSQKMFNPIAMWSICPGTIVTDFAISPDLHFIAATSSDGLLRIYGMTSNELIVSFKSYFGGFTCLSWSPDSQYIVTGSEDDLVSLFSVADKTLVARGSAHTAWVSKVTFDEHRCSSGKYYRFASIGQDCKVVFWEFSYDTILPPKVHHPQRRRLSKPPQYNPSPENLTKPVIPPIPKSQACGLEPLAINKVTTSPCSDIYFLGPDLLVVAGWAGQLAFFLFEPEMSRLTSIDASSVAAATDHSKQDKSNVNTSEKRNADVSDGKLEASPIVH